MIYAYDLYLPLPVKDIYDTLMMLATVNAAKDMYEKGLKEMEDFNKRFGDFYSPIMKDMDWYDKNVTGQARDVINQLYAAGIDPLRSPEGRMLISRFVNNVPVGTVNKLKQSAIAAEKYLEAKGALDAKGLYNPNYEDWRLGGRNLDNWDTTSDGMWLTTSPGEYRGLNALTHEWYDLLKPSFLRTENGYDYTGVSPEAMDKVTASQIPGFIDSSIGGYHYELAKRQLMAQGNPNPSLQQITLQLMSNIRSENSEVLHETKTVNPMYLENVKFRHTLAQQANAAKWDDWKDAQKHKREHPEMYDDDGRYIGNDPVEKANRGFVSDVFNGTLNRMAGSTQPRLKPGGTYASIYYNDPLNKKTLFSNYFNMINNINQQARNGKKRESLWDICFSTFGQTVTRKEFLHYLGADKTNINIGDGDNKINLNDSGNLIMSKGLAKRLISQEGFMENLAGSTMGFGVNADWRSEYDAQVIKEIKEDPSKWTIVSEEGLIGGPMKNNQIKHYFVVTVQDKENNRYDLLLDALINSNPSNVSWYGKPANANGDVVTAASTNLQYLPETDYAGARVDSYNKFKASDTQTNAYDQ